MAFELEAAKVPSSIGDLSIVLTDYIDEETTSTASYEVQIRDADGGMFKLATGDLMPHLTAAQISGLKTLMASIRTKAQKLIPEE